MLGGVGSPQGMESVINRPAGAAWEAGADRAFETMRQLKDSGEVVGELEGKGSVEAKGAKVNVMRDLAADTGLPESVVAELIKQWSYTSNDDDYRALWLQKMAAEEFGVELSEWQAAKIAEMEEYRARYDQEVRTNTPWYQYEITKRTPFEDMTLTRPNSPDWMLDILPTQYGSQEEAGRAFLRAMYDRTQSFLVEHGVEEVTLYRGQQYFREEGGVPDLGSAGQAVHNSVESWSSSLETARSFGSDWNERISGVVDRTVIPRARILSTPFTGFGSLDESEFTVLGGLGQAEVVFKDGESNE